MRQSDLPVGTVSFLFTDIEGSTRLLQETGPGFRQVLERNDELVRDAILTHGAGRKLTKAAAMSLVEGLGPVAAGSAFRPGSGGPRKAGKAMSIT